MYIGDDIWIIDGLDSVYEFIEDWETFIDNELTHDNFDYTTVFQHLYFFNKEMRKRLRTINTNQWIK